MTVLKKISKVFFVLFMGFVLFSPTETEAVNPFGGAVGTIYFCQFDNIIYVDIGPPRGGPHLWSSQTKTYDYGPPSHSGQWLLGLRTGVMHVCVVTRTPSLWLESGMLMLIEGSSP